MIWVYARFNPDIYFTLGTPNCAAAIDAYLDYHRRFEEQLKKGQVPANEGAVQRRQSIYHTIPQVSIYLCV
jgi:hypothetical protein